MMVAIMATFYLISCNDDPTPCEDQTLASFDFVLMDEEENLIFDDEGFDIENIKIYALEDDELNEVEFEVKTSSEDLTFVSSINLSEISLEEGVVDFRVQWDEDNFIDFTYAVNSSVASGCLSYSYEAQLEEEDLETLESGNNIVYVIAVPA